MFPFLLQSCFHHLMLNHGSSSLESLLVSVSILAVCRTDSLFFPDFEPTGRFSALCAQYIEENAQVCVKTEGWLELPKPALTRLLQSDEVRSLEPACTCQMRGTRRGGVHLARMHELPIRDELLKKLSLDKMMSGKWKKCK